jgi:predicted DNA-binding ribbon-helix-helix protein
MNDAQAGVSKDGRTHSSQAGVPAMKSTVVKRSIKIDGHKTSVSLEDGFWFALKEIAGGRHITLAELVALIDAKREHPNLSSAIRVFILDHTRLGEGTANALLSAETGHPAESAQEDPPLCIDAVGTGRSNPHADRSC